MIALLEISSRGSDDVEQSTIVPRLRESHIKSNFLFDMKICTVINGLQINSIRSRFVNTIARTKSVPITIRRGRVPQLAGGDDHNHKDKWISLPLKTTAME